MVKLCTIAGVRTFRNNVGVAWIGKSKRFTATTKITVGSGDVLIQNARVFHGGLCVGSSDIIGLRSVTVTPEMVGKTIAQFMAVEVKTENGRTSKEQKAFIEMVTKFGGVAFVAKTENEAFQLLNDNL